MKIRKEIMSLKVKKAKKVKKPYFLAPYLQLFQNGRLSDF
jgi:hypothetical protein